MHPALRPIDVGPVRLRNRIVKTATFEGMTPGGRATDALVAHHRAMARARVALSCVAYAAVEPEGRTFADQLVVDDRSLPGLSRLAEAVRAEGAIPCLQLAHAGGFSKIARPPKGPSFAPNPYGLLAGRPFVRAMTKEDLARVEAAFVGAAERARDAGFGAVELHLGHGYLLSQFLSPVTNRRRDAFGGGLEGRMRFPVGIVASVARAVGRDLAILVKLNVADGVPGGLEPNDAARIAAACEAAGAHAVVASGGMVQRSAFFLLRGDVPLAAMARGEPTRAGRLALRCFGPLLVRRYPYAPGYFLEPGRAVVEAVSIPVAAVGGLDGARTLARAANMGYRLFAMGRALLSDPDLVERLARGEDVRARCDHCNLCVAHMHEGVRCVRFSPRSSAAVHARE